jgi:nucleoside-diphosphate-sugar epimerase
LAASDRESSRTVLVSGATGVLGAGLVRALCQRGYHVRALSPKGDTGRARVAGLDCEIVEGDVRDAASVPGLFDGVDTVYHLAAVILSPDPVLFDTVNRRGTAQMIEGAARAGVRHFIYVSSASVTYPQLTRYAESKLVGEALVKSEHGFAYTIARPTLVYDEAGGQEFMLFLRYLQRSPAVPFIGTGDAWKRPVWAGDVVAGLAAMAGNPSCHGKTYNLSGGGRIRMRDLARLMLEHHGQRRLFVHLPVAVARGVAICLQVLMRDPPLTLQAIAGIINDADLPPDDAERDLGYHPLDVHEGFARCFPRGGKAVPPASRAPLVVPGNESVRIVTAQSKAPTTPMPKLTGAKASKEIVT